MKVTKQFLMDYATAKGSWTKSQLALLGLPWPPPRGWQYSVEGKMLSENEVEQFRLAGLSKRKGDIHAIYSGLIKRLNELPEIELIILRNKINSIIEVKR